MLCFPHLHPRDEGEEAAERGVVLQVLPDEGFQFVAVGRVAGADAEGGQLIGQRGAGGRRGVVHERAELADMPPDDGVVLGLVPAVAAERGAYRHECVEAHGERGVVDRHILEVAQLIELPAVAQAALAGLLPVHPTAQHQQQAALDMADEVVTAKIY